MEHVNNLYVILNRISGSRVKTYSVSGQYARCLNMSEVRRASAW